MRKVVLALSAALVALAALLAFAVQYQQHERARTTMAGLPPFANPDFDVLVSPPIVTVPESGGSISVRITLKATKLTIGEVLVLETHSGIPGYAANFKPTSVTLHPGNSTSIELTVIIPSGVQKGTYSMSIVAKGKTTQGGSWLIIIVGESRPPPPP